MQTKYTLCASRLGVWHIVRGLLCINGTGIGQVYEMEPNDVVSPLHCESKMGRKQKLVRLFVCVIRLLVEAELNVCSNSEFN